MKPSANINIGAFTHPKHGTYFIWYDPESHCYGIGRSDESHVWCAYATLASLLNSKGL
jgi:hypothetical protein